MESEFADRPVFSLDEQIKIMDRAKANPTSTRGSATSASS